MNTIIIKQELDFEKLKELCWQGALDTLNTVEYHGKQDKLVEYLYETYKNELPELSDVNDFIWFNRDEIYNVLNIRGEI